MSLTKLSTSRMANEGAVLHLLHPVTNEPLFADDDGKLPVTIRLLGSDSDASIRRNNELTDRMLTPARGKTVKITSASADADAVDNLVIFTLGWENFPAGWVKGDDDETPISFSMDNARSLYSNPGVRWVRNQAERFIGDRANFISAS